MRNINLSVLTATAFSCLVLTHSLLQADNKTDKSFEENKSVESSKLNESLKTADLNKKVIKEQPIQVSAFEPFTGKVMRNKVRLRVQPNFEGPVIRELNRDDLIVIDGELDDFYTVQPFSDTKAYIYRTYVLDNVVEGTKVNVRLKPDLDSPVIAQLNSGDRVNGTVDSNNSKWMEITIPAITRFYVAKDYIEKIGDATFITRMEKRREEVNRLLNTTNSISATEMFKSFDQVNLDGVVANYKHIINDYADFPAAVEQAKEALSRLQAAYTNKKIAYLESQSANSAIFLETKSKQMENELKAHKSKISQLEQQIQQEKKNLVFSENQKGQSKTPVSYPANMLAWVPVEDALFNNWSQQTGNPNRDTFYREQAKKGFNLKGIIEPYNRSVKNRPGDYMLVNADSRLPIAFLYSTQVNLQDYVGHEISLLVTPRSNNHFAYPAYFVLSVE